MQKVDEIKQVVRETLGDTPSKMFLLRIDKILDDAGSNDDALLEAIVRVEKMVNLFICTNMAQELDERCTEILSS
jgi:hypothetical protein